MKGYERATKEEIYDRLRIEANCHAQIERIRDILNHSQLIVRYEERSVF